jgi:hypothetical protein
MKNKLYFVAMLTLFLVSLIFFVICEIKNIKQNPKILLMLKLNFPMI